MTLFEHILAAILVAYLTILVAIFLGYMPQTWRQRENPLDQADDQAWHDRWVEWAEQQEAEK